MNIVPHHHHSCEAASSKIQRFFAEFHIGQILRSCNAYKLRGFAVMAIFLVAFEAVFQRRSFYQRKKDAPESILFERDTFYRFLNSCAIHWRKFTLLLFDSWFCSPASLHQIHELGYDIIARVKKSENDALTAHTAIVFARYMMLALEQRRNMDERSLGKLFYLTIDELEDLHYLDALVSLLSLLMDCAKEAEILDEDQVNQLLDLLDLFVAKLPDLWGKCLIQCA